MSPPVHHFALLAPVPLEHLESSLHVKEDFVAYGTRKWELLQKLDSMRESAPVSILIYPSDEDVAAKDTFAVSWFGWYIGHELSNTGRHSKKMKHRPQSTANYPADNLGHWAAFWHVRGLRRLPREKQIAIGKIKGLPGGWRKDAPPRGPELVELPEILSHETFD
jgi:hypothetical protein